MKPPRQASPATPPLQEGNWKKTRIGQFLFERKGKYKPDDKAIAGLNRIDKIDFSGNFHIAQKPSKTNMILICPGDLVISGINVSKGALGIYHSDEDVTATIHYSSYTFDKSKIDVEYFKRFLKSSAFINLLQEQVKGGIKTEIKPKHILPLEIELPDIKEQKQKVQHFKSIESEDTELKQELTHQQSLLKKLRQQILQEAIEGKLTQDWRKQQKLSPCQGGVPRSGEGVSGQNSQKITETGVPPSGEGVGKRINNLPYLKTFRKKLRNNLTPAEAKLWTMLKGKQLQGRKFRRQHSVANYILDFYCPAEKLAIELDGEVHNNPQAAEHDRERDLFLAHTGIQVLRFENKIVFENPDGLLEQIKQEFSKTPSPHFQGGVASRSDDGVVMEVPRSGEGVGDEVVLDPSAPAGHLPLAGEKFESARELLARIQAEKDQLIQDKQIKKQKPLPPISEAEKPFDLPDSWVWCRLGEVCSKVTDGFHNTPRKLKKGRVYISATHIRETGIRWANCLYVSEIDHAELYKKAYPQKGEILITNRGAGCATPAIIDIDEQFSFQNAALIGFNQKMIENEFIYYFILKMRDEIIETFVNGGLQPMLSNAKLRTIPLSLPPLPEQKAIVAKVEKLLALCDQLETQISHNQTHAAQLTQAVLKEAFSPATTQNQQLP